jgi:putative tryptophan/tyrosine transport system substrate-binding protein
MKRREFITGLGGAAAWPVLGRAQQAALPVVGFIDGGSVDSSAVWVATFRKALGETGYIEGQKCMLKLNNGGLHDA